jgi:glycosyltransferase involved in cell wall biosynthesis
MKKILMIAYYYPPKGGAGVQRTVKFANYLVKYGYEVHVLTVKEDKKGLIDTSLSTEISNGVFVHRTDIKEGELLDKLVNAANKGTRGGSTVEASAVSKNSSIKKIIRSTGKKVFLNMYNLYYIPDDKKGWIDYAVSEGLRIIKENKIDLIYTTSAPYTSHIIGLKIKKQANVNWIADFRDPWASNPFVSYNFLVQHIYNNQERKIVKNADRVLSVSQPIIDDFTTRYKSEDRDKFVVITNGFDEEDFKGVDVNLSKENDRFTILYNGTLYGKRFPEGILKSVENLIFSGKISKDRIVIKFVGEIGSEHRGTVEEYALRFPGVVEHRDYIPHRESIQELCSANALLLIIDEGKGSEGIFTGKIFEYIRTSKPVIAVVPDGAARELIKQTGTGFLAYPSKQVEIEKAIYDAYRVFCGEDKDFNPDMEAVKMYSREDLAKKLMKVIEKL